jgi:hypothetical protein
MSTLYVDTLEPNQNTSITAAAGKLLPVGHVIDHKYMQYGTSITLSTATYTDTGLTLNITPKSTSSKFIITYNVFLYYVGVANQWVAATGRILRDSTVIHTDTYSLGRGALYNVGGPNAYIMFNTTDTYEDEPSTTSQITYKVQFSSYQSRTIYVNSSNQKAFLSVREIAQ